MIKGLIKIGFTFIVLGFVLYFLWIFVYPKLNAKGKELSKDDSSYVLVIKVIDGDTFIINDKKESRVRVIGIDTPEKYDSQKLDRDAARSGKSKKVLKELGERSYEYTRELIEKKKVKLIEDKNYVNKDKYGRLLRYVYLEDGTFFNKKIIEEGFANVYRDNDISLLNELILAEKYARENKLGLWSNK